MKTFSLLAAASLCATAFQPAWAATVQDEPTRGAEAAAQLAVGDAAPALHVADWVQGSAIERFEPGKVYVVEFWATWCGPCLRSIPHLTHLSKQYQDQGVTIVGVTTEDPNNSLEQVRELVSQRGQGMAYTVAFDEGSSTNEAWMKASGQQGIPASFLVDQDGRIAWIGHPMWLDMPLAAVVAGEWDAVEGPRQLAEAQKRYEKLAKAVKKDPAVGLEELAAFQREYPALAGMTHEMQFHAQLLAGMFDEASATGAEIFRTASASFDPMALNQLAWTIVDPLEEWAERDLDLALRAAKLANDLTDAEDAAILDTLARVYFWKGDIEKALELQERAVSFAEGRMKEQLEPVVEEYRKAKEGSRAGT